MIHRYPAAVKAFYMQPDPKDPTKALCVDVLAPEGYGEIIGGSQRVDSYDLLKQRIEDHNLPMAAFQWYLDLRKYGSVPHSGFGMGIERCVAWICGLEHVRETIPFARTLNRIYQRQQAISMSKLPVSKLNYVLKDDIDVRSTDATLRMPIPRCTSASKLQRIRCERTHRPMCLISRAIT